MIDKSTNKCFRISWLAYVKPTLVSIILIFLIFLFNLNPIISLPLLFIVLAWYVYNIFYIKNIILYTDCDGVWAYSGVFPWNKGVSGVKWQDLEEAVFFTGFISWLLKSYSIKIGNRFTKSNELFLKNVKNGHYAVEHINNMHIDIINKNGDK